MDFLPIDVMARLLARGASRRGLAALAGGVGLAALTARDSEAGKRKKRKKKQRQKKKKKPPVAPAMANFCLNGETVSRRADQGAAAVAEGAFPGACPQDTCAGGCGANMVCDGGVCRACTVTCGANPTVCGQTLQAALTIGGEVIVCPGRYPGGFTVPGNATLIGAGAGPDPARHTILDGGTTQRVLASGRGTSLAVRQIRIAGGRASSGGGVMSDGVLATTDCVVTQNQATSGGGGIFHSSFGGDATLTRTVISKNEAFSFGGGVAAYPNTRQLKLISSIISGNIARDHVGGGIYRLSGPTILDSSCQIVNNTAGSGGGGIYSPAQVQQNGALIAGNSAPQCSGTTCV